MFAIQSDYFIYWRRLVVISAGLAVGYFVYRWQRDFLEYPYIQFLVTYHFGFTKRALIGQIASFGFERIPVWLPFATGAASILTALALYLRVFGKTFGFSRDTTPLLVFTAGSPFFFKGFVAAAGYFDIFGCIIATALLLMPARSFWFLVSAAIGSVFLVLVHQLQILLYIPTILTIVVFRHYLSGSFRRAELFAGLAMLLLVGIVAMLAQFSGNVPASRDEFTSYLMSRNDAGENTPKWAQYIYVYYRTLSDEIKDTWLMLPTNAMHFPLYAFLVACHAPLIRYFRDTVAALDGLTMRRLAAASIVVVGCAYVVIFATVFDYARWLGNLFACVVLLLALFSQLPKRYKVQPIPRSDAKTFGLGLLITAFPKISF